MSEIELGEFGHATRARQDAFLAAYAVSLSVTQAAAAAGISRSAHYQWASESEDYRGRLEQARAEAAEHLQAEAYRRSVEGVEEYVVSSGRLVVGEDGRPLKQRRYSDALTIALLKAHLPARYRESRALELTGAGGGDVRVSSLLELMTAVAQSED